MPSLATRVTRLPGGLAVATATMPDRASVSLGFWVAAGGRHELAHHSGVCHFIEHMLFKGTRRRTASQISQAVEGAGGYLNAFTGEEGTCFYARARHDRLELLLDVLSDMVLHSRFAPRDLERERGVILEEIASYLDQPHQHVQELLNSLLWPNHPLGRPLTGTHASVQSLHRRDLVSFQRSHFTSQAAFLVAAGRVRHDRLVRLASRYFQSLSPGPRRAFSPAPCEQTRPCSTLQTKSVEQTQLALGFRTCSRHDSRRYALRIANAILGENMSSRLFQVIREDRGLAYSIYSSLSHFADTGVLAISAGLDTDDLPTALNLILKELERLRRKPPARAEFQRARDYVLGQFDLGLENTESRMQWVGEQLLGYRRAVTQQHVKRKLTAVTPAQVAAAARDFFEPHRLSLALVSPLKSAASLQRRLDRWRPA
jgi:predicted Zn-dependent peptidase